MKKKKLLQVVLAAALSLSLSAAPLFTSQAAGDASDDLKGKPWVTSTLQGNIPADRPDVKDDLYTYYDYDFLKAHQEKPGSVSDAYKGEMMETVLNVLKDKSKTGHDLDQLRIFFDQAMDTETLKKEGLSLVQPYLDRIDAVTSIGEMNELLTASDFPFSPFLGTSLRIKDTQDVNMVEVYPNLLFSDPIINGGKYYQDSEDPNEQMIINNTLFMMGMNSLLDLLAQGMSNEEVVEAYKRMLAFEKPHAKYLYYEGKYAGADFGAYAQKDGFITPDELYSACSNFPMKAILDKLGMGDSKLYKVSKGWPQAFNELWTEENIEVIKEIAKLKILNETRPYRDQTAINQLLEGGGQQVQDALTLAFNACDSMDAFAIELAEIYVKEGLGTKAKDRLTNLTEDLIDTYKDLVKETPWIAEESEKRIIEKLDHMAINMLEPAEGYYDFGGLDLVPKEEGGTLLDNYLKLKQYRLDQQSMMVGKSATTAIGWYEISPTISNAYYNAESNSINILPGYINSLRYTDDMSDTELLGGIGFVIGHEISHGFDYEGAQFDAYGKTTPMFTDDDVDDFVRKTNELSGYFDSIEVMPGVMVDGKNVVTEAAADLSGLQAVLEIAGKNEAIEYADVFGSFAYRWANVLPEATFSQYLGDVHPLHHLRINVSSQMFDPIYETYGVEEGDGMYLAPEKRINIWGAAATVPDPVKMIIFRMYNPNTGEHFFTADGKEQKELVSAGWDNEGEGWIAPSYSDTPVYRLYNPNSGGHHYTSDVTEKDQLISIGWNYEGIGWYSYDKDTSPLYRLYNPNALGQYEAGGHHYTKNAAERDNLVSLGWNDEGIGWYGM